MNIKQKFNRLKEPVLFLVIFIAIVGFIGRRMGISNMFSTLMNSAYDLLMNTVLYIMAIAVLAGVLGAVFSEFGVIDLINRLISPLMYPLYRLPGAASIGVMTTYLSDNAAILALTDDKEFLRFFKKFQVPALTNIGTSFGMGMIISSFVLGLEGINEQAAKIVVVGNLGAIIGSIVSTRMMMHYTIKKYGTEEYVDCAAELNHEETFEINTKYEPIGLRILNSIVEGGKAGVKVGIDIIPGVLIICSLVLLLTNGPSPGGVYTGAASEGIGLLPWLADKLSFILQPLFGFTSSECIAVPITALGSAGAAIALIPNLLANGSAYAGDIAVFTSMCMCWSGYLSTHVAMMESLGERDLTNKAILSHTIGGIFAGVAAHWLYVLL